MNADRTEKWMRYWYEMNTTMMLMVMYLLCVAFISGVASINNTAGPSEMSIALKFFCATLIIALVFSGVVSVSLGLYNRTQVKYYGLGSKPLS